MLIRGEPLVVVAGRLEGGKPLEPARCPVREGQATTRREAALGWHHLLGME